MNTLILDDILKPRYKTLYIDALILDDILKPRYKTLYI